MNVSTTFIHASQMPRPRSEHVDELAPEPNNTLVALYLDLPDRSGYIRFIAPAGALHDMFTASARKVEEALQQSDVLNRFGRADVAARQTGWCSRCNARRTEIRDTLCPNCLEEDRLSAKQEAAEAALDAATQR